MSGALTFGARIGSKGGIRALVNEAVALENAGFDQVWVSNDLFGQSGLVGLSAIAALTTRIKFGSGVLDPVTLHPVQIAMAASSLQELSGDRFLLGLGAGSDVFFGWAGIIPIRPVPRTRQAITTVRALLAGESPMHVDGLDSVYTEQAVLHAPRPTPIYVGAMGPKMLQMTGRLADGALALCLPPSQYHQVATQIGAGAEAAGRSLDDMDIAACLWCSVDDDAEQARRAMAAQIARYAGSLSVDALLGAGQDPAEFAHVASLIAAGRPDDAIDAVSPRMLQLGIVGGTNDVIDQCLDLLTQGVRHLSFGPPMGPSPAAALALFGKVVLPALRR